MSSISAIHQAVFHGETSPTIHTHELMASAVNAPKIQVAFSNKDRLACLSYLIERTSWLDLPDMTTPKGGIRQDYLWESNCIECFFEFESGLGYIEMNVSPHQEQYHYNMYDFHDYRMPHVMPPMHADGNITIHHSSILKTHHIYHLAIDFAQKNQKITKINPCVILYQENTPIFYAINHASPPDFHAKSHWLAV
ncbi:hypothetical protein M2R47_02150 [Moraxella sp. Tifton1]|uniref:DOMON-like domain-containing protein n=1 Tax=Moraxella oculi TaxID=2940516 RepID=A0ABW8U7E8_9GAMM|nr:hypothetical protein [Moraxella sp. Tifton1]MCL1623056.1 hypothetical protein [Moraxella sp. Tifton1]